MNRSARFKREWRNKCLAQYQLIHARTWCLLCA